MQDLDNMSFKTWDEMYYVQQKMHQAGPKLEQRFIDKFQNRVREQFENNPQFAKDYPDYIEAQAKRVDKSLNVKNPIKSVQMRKKMRQIDDAFMSKNFKQEEICKEYEGRLQKNGKEEAARDIVVKDPAIFKKKVSVRI